MSGIKVVSYAAIDKGALLGFASVEMPSGVIFIDVGIFRKNNATWASPPQRPVVRDGTAVRDVSGRIKYVNVMSFTDKAARDRFSAAIVDAVRAAGHIE